MASNRRGAGTKIRCVSPSSRVRALSRRPARHSASALAKRKYGRGQQRLAPGGASLFRLVELQINRPESLVRFPASSVQRDGRPQDRDRFGMLLPGGEAQADARKVQGVARLEVAGLPKLRHGLVVTAE